MVSSILQNKDYIMDRIIQETGMTREELEKRIKEKIEMYGGLLTEAGAAFSIAKELGITLDIPTSSDEYTEISKINEDLGFVNIAGIVKAVSPVKNWEKDDRSGKIARILVADNTGEIWVVLWNDDAELVELGKIKPGTVIAVKNAIIKKRLDGSLELSPGMRGRIIIEPKIEKELPEIPKPKRISELSPGETATVYGRITRKFQKKEFETNGRKGIMASMLISDGTQIRVVLWGDHSKILDSANVGDIVKIENGLVKENINGNLEIHANWASRVLLNPEDSPDLSQVPTVPRKTISSLKPGEFVEIRGTVVQIYPPTVIKVCPVCGKVVDDVCPEHGKSKKTIILNIEIDDGTGVIRGVLFRDIAERFLGIEDLDSDNIEEKIDSVLGKEFLFIGNISENDVFDRIELTVRDFSEPNLDREIQNAKG